MPTVYSKLADEDDEEGRENFGSVFRSSFLNGEIPFCVLGSTQVKSRVYHVVRLQTENDKKGLKSLAKDPYQNISASNSVVVSHSFLKKSYPQMLCNYFRADVRFRGDAKDEVSKVKDILYSLELKKAVDKKTGKDLGPIERNMMKDLPEHLDLVKKEAN